MEKREYHNREKEEVLEELEVSVSGLSDAEASERISKYGKNDLPKVRRKPLIVKFLMQFNDALIYILIAAGFLAIALAVIYSDVTYWIDAGVIFGVVIINAIVGFIQEIKAQKALDAIKNMLSLSATVVRNGERREIPASELTIGDIVYLRAGDKVPCDVRLISTSRFEVDESMLTGESLAVEKNTDSVAEDAVLGERFCLSYGGTNVTFGDALGVCIKIGANTEVGKISAMLKEAKTPPTPLMKKMNKLGIALSIIILALVAISLPIALAVHGKSVPAGVLAAIGLAVAAIPEGLPAILTIILAIGVRRMAKQNAIVKTLPSAETLGSVTVICSDKTGTLTKNEMTATNIYTEKNSFSVSGTGYSPKGEIEGFIRDELYWLIACADLCNESGVYEKDGQWFSQGAPTEAALKALAKKSGIEIKDAVKLADLPFSSEHKFRAGRFEVDGKRVVFLNGAPERVISMCKGASSDFWNKKMEEIASSGQRMIGLAYCNADAGGDSLDMDMLTSFSFSFLGIVGIIDPPKPEAIEAIRIAREAGVRVKMITGDHVLTARTIAFQMGLTDNDRVVSGAEIEKMTDEQLKEVALEADIYARTSPEHKLRLVKALQEAGEIVSMTGDGVNDAPALKKANMGVAMGIKGTEVTKEASKMVLADDNFATIVSAVKEGRTIFDNIKKTLLFILPANGAQGLVILVAMLFGLTLPISALQILWVNMVVAVTLALSMSFEPSEKTVMQRPVRSPKEWLITPYMLFKIFFISAVLTGLTMAVFFVSHRIHGFSLYRARTLAVNTISFGCLFYLLSVRSRGHMFTKQFVANKVVFIVISILIALQMAITYIPFMNTAFRTARLKALDWVFVLAAGIMVMLVSELEKVFSGLVSRRKLKKNL